MKALQTESFLKKIDTCYNFTMCKLLDQFFLIW